MFKELNSTPDFPQQEKSIIDKWNRLDIVKTLRNQKSNSKERVYYDGPITANGMPHYGHALTWILKDVIPRYWSMSGFKVLRNMGWDCQGIPVEYEVEKSLNFEKKEDIEAFGVEKFNQLCRESVLKYQDTMFDYEALIGRWYDKDEIYSTMDPNYIESIWWSLKELYKKGLLYEGYKVVAYSTRAGTTLSTHEVNDGGYKELEDPWITVKFGLKDTSSFSALLPKEISNVYVLAWTTTPWTMPGNLMLAVGNSIKYVLVQFESNAYIVAKERLEAVFEGKTHGVLGDIEAKDLIGLEYNPPFSYYESKRQEGCFRILAAGHTNTEDGTGIVHLAPYGAEDFDVFMEKGIQIFDYLDETANFKSEIPEYVGLFYKQANKKIISDLESKGVLFSHGTLLHRMPMCWRTNTPLIYKPVKSWYVAVTKIKDKMKEENQKLNWFPDHLKDGNSGIWINNARDWALSRSRYWGTPMPVWVNDKTGEMVVVGSFEELKQLSGQTLSDPHKPFVDQITWEGNDGGTFRRIKDVIDVWYDSGAMPFARWHYPFENQYNFKNSFPAEYISEGPDQVRLWFYVMHVLGVALFDQVPYQNVVTFGTMLDEHGKKLSKSKKNYKPLDEVLNVYGADVLRYFVLNSSIMNGYDTNFSEKMLNDARKEFFLILWNSLKYFVSYANIHNFKPDNTYPALDQNNQYLLLDEWLLAKYKELHHLVLKHLSEYKILEAFRLFTPFVTDMSTWYIRRSRDRVKDGDLNSLKTLYYVFTELAKLLAPFLPFISEEMYEILDQPNLTQIPSVHLDDYTEVPNLSAEDKKLLVKMDITRKVVTLAHSIRVAEGVKIRQPLPELSVEFKDNSLTESDLIKELITDELNVKRVLTGVVGAGYKSAEDNQIRVLLDTNITDELKVEGAARDLVREVQELRKGLKLDVTNEIILTLPENEMNNAIVSSFGDFVKSKTQAKLIKLDSALDVIQIKPEL